VKKGRLSCDIDAPQVGSAWSDSTRVVKVNRRKMNCHKKRPYCIWKYPQVMHLVRLKVYYCSHCE